MCARSTRARLRAAKPPVERSASAQSQGRRCCFTFSPFLPSGPKSVLGPATTRTRPFSKGTIQYWMSGPRGSEANAERGGHLGEWSSEKVEPGFPPRGAGAVEARGASGSAATETSSFGGRITGTGGRLASITVGAPTFVGAEAPSAERLTAPAMRFEEGTADKSGSTTDAAAAMANDTTIVALNTDRFIACPVVSSLNARLAKRVPAKTSRWRLNRQG
jgi:hypothetical protein